jgi:hypothetical protein
MMLVRTFAVLMLVGLTSTSASTMDLFIQTLIRTFETPISSESAGKGKFSVQVMLNNDAFNLDDALRLFIQQFLVATLHGHIDLMPESWQSDYPGYAQVIDELNKVLDLIGVRPLSGISMRDIRAFVQSKTHFYVESLDGGLSR